MARRSRASSSACRWPSSISWRSSPPGWAGCRRRAHFWFWVVVAAVSQILATSLQLHVMGCRNFATAVAYAKTEVVQAAVFEVVFLGAFVSGFGALGIALATVAVMLMSLIKTDRPCGRSSGLDRSHRAARPGGRRLLRCRRGGLSRGVGVAPRPERRSWLRRSPSWSRRRFRPR